MIKYLLGLRRWLLCVVLLLSAAGRVAGQAPGWAWAVSPDAGEGRGTAMAVDGLGNVYVTGYFSGTATFGATTLTSAGPADTDMFVAKLTRNGTYQWAVGAGGGGNGDGKSVAVDAGGNVYVTGYYSGITTFGTTTLADAGRGDVFVAKLTSGGAWQWATSAGGSNSDVSTGVAVDGRGNVVITGSFTSPVAAFGLTPVINSTAGYPNIFVAKLTNGGSWQWAIGVGASNSYFQAGEGVDVDSSGNIYVSGNFGGTPVTFGSTTLTTAGNTDLYVAKLTAAGAWLWATSAGGTGDDTNTDITVDSNNEVVITGRFFSGTATFGPTTLTNTNPGNPDIFVAKLSTSGAWQWATNASVSDGYDEVLGVSVDGSANIYVTGDFGYGTFTFGSTTLASPNSYDVFVAKLSAAGSWQWATSAGGTAGDAALGVGVDGSGNVYVTGNFTSPIATFGPITLPNLTLNSSGFAIFIARLGTTTGLPEDATSPLTLTPNPATATVQLTNAPGATATLFDGLGRVMRTAPLTAGATTLDVRGLAAGLYVVRCGGVARRLVVE